MDFNGAKNLRPFLPADNADKVLDCHKGHRRSNAGRALPRRGGCQGHAPMHIQGTSEDSLGKPRKTSPWTRVSSLCQGSQRLGSSCSVS